MNREVKQTCRGYAHTEGGHDKEQRETQTGGLGQSEHTWGTQLKRITPPCNCNFDIQYCNFCMDMGELVYLLNILS